MLSRRYFLRGVPAIFIPKLLRFKATKGSNPSNLIVSTWNNQIANQIAYKTLESQNNLLDAIEQGVNYVEANIEDQSVGNGGRPDRSGKVSLDACIMDSNGNAGGVCFLRDTQQAISVARKVMEETPHVLLAGDGAKQFARKMGYAKTKILSKKSKQEYKQWKKSAIYKPKINSELHDTIGMLAQKSDGNIAGACSTSGLAYKLPGRVGDSPILGAGLYVDNEIGAAAATGMGELVLRHCGTFLVVELMRQGNSVQKACELAIDRIVKREKSTDFQVGFVAIDKQGEIGAYSIQKGFVYTVTKNAQTTVYEAKAHFD